MIWYLDLDRQTQQYDEGLRESIRQDKSFRGIRRAADTEIIATSDSTASKVRGRLKEIAGRSEKPSKIVVLDHQELESRKVEIIRERVRRIPGSNILKPDLVAAVRNYYAVQMALSQEDVGSSVVEHFRDCLEEYDHGNRVSELGDPEKYDELTLVDEIDNEERDALNDIFLPIVEATEHHCIAPVSEPRERQAEIEDCRAFLMLTFWQLWAEKSRGMRIRETTGEAEYESVYREAIRDGDNWGCWMLPEDTCTEQEARRLRHLAWTIEQIINQHWDGDEHESLYPEGPSIREMSTVDEPFVVFQKDEQVRGGATPS